MKITDNHIEILKHLALGLTAKEIAGIVYASEWTIEKNIYKMRIKFGCRNVVHLIYFATKEGIIE